MMMILSLLISAQFSFAMDIESTLRDAARRAYPPMSESVDPDIFRFQQLVGTVHDMAFGAGVIALGQSLNKDPFSNHSGKKFLLTLFGAAYGFGNTGLRIYTGMLHERDPGVFPMASLAYELVKGSPGLGATQLEFRAPKGAGE